ncbi:hypothetical protein RvY_15662 [Ramazzottius varieornatus]|uniref:Dol-P-Glc:Glc(2)Man(9)GlcNAc(2)-PP-Dol alpha-1,2-glucosyltransferase n=1 Tax=Ramazzottius varieornatus TaxID=947166 RepID=A0A1D1W2F7_RAMVA|nr:hypothetical protein RvY_15662 [Ramazzottius varieornatus]
MVAKKLDTLRHRGLRSAAVVIFAVITYRLLMSMHNSVLEPYMDEEFHIRQSKAYCAGNFTQWDPKLTTLPGLYFVALGLWKAVSLFVHLSDPCSIWLLRMTNYVFAVGNIFLYQKILSIIHHDGAIKMTGLHVLLTSINLATFPLLYFFTFLYYTEHVSAFLVFAMLYGHLRGNRKLAALLGAAAVFTRQTNVIWVGSLALLEVFKQYKVVMKGVADDRDLRRLSADKDVQVLLAPFVSLKKNPSSTNVKRLLGYFAGVAMEGLPRVLGYIVVLLAFLVFVIVNRGIVVGDRNAHQAVLHLPQLLYFNVFTLFFASPFLLTPDKLKRFLRSCSRHRRNVMVVLVFILAAIYGFTCAHPYLLADNRHYTFYIWRNVLNRNWYARYLASPVYLCGLWALSDELRYRGFFQTLVFLLSCLALLTPQKLLEFRYFIVPYMLFRMQMKQSTMTQLALEFLLYQSVNALTLYLFMYKPFYWENSTEEMHFMW